MEALAMNGSKVMERFVESRPLCVMTRCILGHLMTDDLDGVFAQCRQRQYQGDIKFSALAASVADCRLELLRELQPSVQETQGGTGGLGGRLLRQAQPGGTVDLGGSRAVRRPQSDRTAPGDRRRTAGGAGGVQVLGARRQSSA